MKTCDYLFALDCPNNWDQFYNLTKKSNFNNKTTRNTYKYSKILQFIRDKLPHVSEAQSRVVYMYNRQ